LGAVVLGSPVFLLILVLKRRGSESYYYRTNEPQKPSEMAISSFTTEFFCLTYENAAMMDASDPTTPHELASALPDLSRTYEVPSERDAENGGSLERVKDLHRFV
jgi:hypothetical protein